MTSSQFSGEQFIIVFLVASKIVSSEIVLVPEVTINEGTLRGATLKSRNGRNYHAFKGIRYVEKPERFEIAKPAKSWEGVREAFEEGDACTQQLPSSVGALLGTIGSEDCLFLHVFTPHENEEKKLPVMVYIHGGAFIFGSSAGFPSTYLLDEDIVYVAFNYRLAAFGFLYNEDDLIPGNLGLKDQVAALLWVQRNIHHFGGDPNQITIFGESAGAVSVHFMMLSPMSKGLFHRAIMQSGNALVVWSLNLGAKGTTEKFAAAVGCPTENAVEMVNCLKNADAEDLANVQAESRWSTLPEYHWAPVIERGDPTKAFLSEHPKAILERGQVSNNVPLIIGLNKNEGAAIFAAFILNDPDLIEEINEKWNEISPVAFIYLNERYEVVPKYDGVSVKIREFYFGNHRIGHDTEQRLTDAFSDRYFNHATIKTVKFHSKMAPTYLYRLTFTVGSSLIHNLGMTHFEPPTHADELPYLFPIRFKDKLNNPIEIDFSNKFVKLWASFATLGRPEATWGSAVTWPMANASVDSLTWYRIDKNTQLITDSLEHRMKFWDDLLANELKDLY